MDISWMKKGACHQQPHLASMFFLDEIKKQIEAKKICATCPVRVECLDYALKTHQDHGTWAGTSARERWRILKQRRSPS